MVAVHSNNGQHHPATSATLNWSDVMAGHFPDTAYRQAYRQAVQEVAEKAKEVLTASHARIDQAMKMVLQGDVKLLDDGTARVASQSTGEYYDVNGTCPCKEALNQHSCHQPQTDSL